LSIGGRCVDQGWRRYVVTFSVMSMMGLGLMYWVFGGWSTKMVISALGPAAFWTAILLRRYDLMRNSPTGQKRGQQE
jgi:hypothetical protein